MPDFVLIPYSVLTNQRLTPAEKVVYGAIYWLDQDERHCFAKNETIAEICGQSPISVSHALTSLEHEKYIYRTYEDAQKKRRKAIICLLTFKKAHEHSTGLIGLAQLGQSVSPVGLQIHNALKESLPPSLSTITEGGEDLLVEPDEDFVPSRQLLKKKAKSLGWRGPEIRALFVWGESQLEKGRRFTNPTVQMQAIGRMFRAGYSVAEVKEQWEWMGGQKRWEFGYDFTDVAREIHKIHVR